MALVRTLHFHPSIYLILHRVRSAGTQLTWGEGRVQPGQLSSTIHFIHAKLVYSISYMLQFFHTTPFSNVVHMLRITLGLSIIKN